MAKDSTFTHEICVEEKANEFLFREHCCSHSYCTDCIITYISSKLENSISTIKCPVSGCIGVLDHNRCRAVEPTQVLDKWGDALFDSLVLGFEKMYCPFKDCSGMMLADENRSKKEIVLESECSFCKRHFCGQCMVPWHSGMDCWEFDETSDEAKMVKELVVRRKWKRCSKCRFYVERSEGCLFMTCRCGHTFCYNCGAPMKDHCYEVCNRMG